MVQPRFVRSSPSSPSSVAGEPKSSNLYVANCGPAVGLSHDAIVAAFSAFGEVKGVYAADESGVRVVVAFADPFSAKSALEALSGRPCTDLDGRTLHIRYSVLQLPSQVNECVPVSLSSSDLNIPGLFLLPDFVTAEEEQQLLAAVDTQPWIGLAKRRVQHYGYEFCYGTRNVDTRNRLGELPPFVSPILERISLFPNLDYDLASLNLDQLTVNEYPSGVGLSPHIDTHSAFEDCIFSLSLAGPCIMEFRRYSASTWKVDEEKPDSTTCIKKALYLPPRSMLLLSGEARYAWNHYIPHHKIDKVKDKVIRRSPRRVSFTLRKVRNHPCRLYFILNPLKSLESRPNKRVLSAQQMFNNTLLHLPRPILPTFTSCRASRKILSKRMSTATEPKVRKFESVEGADLNSISKPDGIRFRLVSYNILAQVYVKSSFFPHSPPVCLKWKARSHAILSVLKKLHADFFCLQEVDEYDSFYRKNMESLGYSGIYIQRTGQRKRDGCAIFYKPSCAELVTKERIEYNDLLDSVKADSVSCAVILMIHK
ncbi:Alkylated DNA repair protein ALKBH8 [Hirschfeldia incana]|nr:Alkylated DNA repair protein ALKBH8 [Hirschfeldia incana]